MNRYHRQENILGTPLPFDTPDPPSSTCTGGVSALKGVWLQPHRYRFRFIEVKLSFTSVATVELEHHYADCHMYLLLTK